MPAIQFKSDGQTALSLWAYTRLFKGDSGQLKKREDLRNKITTTWPELSGVETDEKQEKERQAALKTERTFEISAKEQTAIAEGMLAFMKDKDISDTQKIPCFELAKLCRFPKWLDKNLETEVRDFDGSDEAPIIEEENGQKD